VKSLSLIRQFLRRNIKAIIGYILFCIAAFVLFFIILFPREEIRERIIYEIEKSTSTEIRTASDKWLFPVGLKFTGMELRNRGAINNPILARIDRFEIDIPFGSIASFSPVSNIAAALYGGTVNGTLTMRSDNRILKANWANIDVTRIERLKSVPVTIEGKVSGDLVIRLAANKPEGQIRILVKDGKFGKLKVMGFTLPDIPLDELNGTVDIKDNTLSLKELRFKNSDIKGSIKGDIKLASGSEPGNLDLAIRFSVGEKMKVQYQGILSFISQTKDREGYYTLHIKGDPGKPSIGI